MVITILETFFYTASASVAPLVRDCSKKQDEPGAEDKPSQALGARAEAKWESWVTSKGWVGILTGTGLGL